jgi:hypothetical protein
MGDDSALKASGIISLPVRVRWSGPDKTYDLGKRPDLIRVYEQVLREGTDDDVRYFIEPDTLAELWDDLVLPPHVRTAWANWFQQHRSIHLSC